MNYPVKVVNVDVDKNAVKTSQDFFANGLKRSRERDVGGHGENVLVVDLQVKTKKGVKRVESY